MNHPYPDGRLPYTWKSVGDYWPRRLLHIPSWTSIENDGSNSYLGVRKPKYNILTYTWGRWKIRDGIGGPTLPVQGTTWRIPAVKEEHFTVEAFQKIVQMMSTDGVEWAWIDIACIDQENDVAQAEEVGKQASIFKNAHGVFVWLSRLDTQVLSNVVATIQTQGYQLREYVDKIPNQFHSPHDLVHELHKNFGIIFGDPWFSSLWTLQEVILRNDALVLSAQAEPIWWEPNQYLFLTIFINYCQNVFEDLSSLEQQLSRIENNGRSLTSKDQEMKDIIAAIKALILQAGFYYLFTDNPNVQYGTARYRTTSRDVDRVYAIMQIYNLRVGKSIRPNENPSLDELVDEFALTINKVCPIIGQWFVHKELPSHRKSWRITKNSTVLDVLMDYQEPRPESTMTSHPLGHVIVVGRCCSFANFLRLTRDIEKGAGSIEAPPTRPIESPQSFALTMRLALDDSVLKRLSENRLFGWTITDLMSANGRLPGWPLVASFGGQNIWILRLGDIRGTWNPRIGKYGRRYAGLIIRRTETSLEPDWLNVPYQRVGVCYWQSHTEKHQQQFEALPWSNVEVELH